MPLVFLTNAIKFRVPLSSQSIPTQSKSIVGHIHQDGRDRSPSDQHAHGGSHGSVVLPSLNVDWAILPATQNSRFRPHIPYYGFFKGASFDEPYPTQ